MSDVNETILRESDWVGDTYQMQTETFSPVEFPLLVEIFKKHAIKSLLDIGTGEGNWIHRFASLIDPEIRIKAIDADSKLIEVAETCRGGGSVTFQHAMFNKDFSDQRYDCILARFSMEHSVDPGAFVAEAYKRLNPGGLFIITEWFIDVHHNSNPIWTIWREKEDQVYRSIGSHPRLALSLPGLLKANGFGSIQSAHHWVSPVTVNRTSFYELTIVYATLYHKMEPTIFTGVFTKQLIDYCQQAIADTQVNGDYYLITQTIGTSAKL